MSLKLKPLSSGATVVNLLGEPGGSQEDFVDGTVAPEVTYPCNFCGHCETPNECAWSRECPVCSALAGKISEATYCRDGRGALTGLHQERWFNA